MVDIAAQAQNLASLRYDPQRDAINRRIAQIQESTRLRNESTQNYGNLARGYVGQTYDTLDQGLAANKGQAMQALDTQAQSIGQGYRDANQVGQALRDQARTYMQGLGQQTGYEQQAAYQQGTLEKLVADLGAANAQRDATVTGNLKNWAGQMGSVYDQQIGTGKMMRADSLSGLEREIVAALGQNNLAGIEQETDMGDELLRILGEQGSYLGEQINEMGAREWEQAFKEAQLRQQAESTNAELSLKAQAMADDRAARGAAQGSDEERWMAELMLKQMGMENDRMSGDRNYQLALREFEAGQNPQASVGERLGIFEALQGSGEFPDEPGDAWRRQNSLAALLPEYVPSPSRGWTSFSGRSSGWGGGGGSTVKNSVGNKNSYGSDLDRLRSLAQGLR